MKTQNDLTVSNTIFLLLFAFSLFLEGILHSALYLFAFLAAILYGIKQAPLESDRLAPLRLSSLRDTAPALPLIPPILALTMLTALGFSYLFALFGIGAQTPPEGSFWQALWAHALLPAVCEEMLFRYLPLLLLGRENPRGLLLTSALFFALGHVSLPHMPYAFLAGVCYMLLVLLTGNVWITVLAHFCNNLLSLLLTFYPSAATGILIAFSLLTIGCIVWLIVRWPTYRDRIRPLLRGRSHEYFTRWPLLYTACVLMLCALAL